MIQLKKCIKILNFKFYDIVYLQNCLFMNQIKQNKNWSNLFRN